LNKSWGYSHFTFSRANSNIGLIEEGPEEDGSFHGHDGHSMKERSLENPYQNITHYRAALNSNILLGHGQLKSTFGFQRNLRSEFENHGEHGHEDHDHEDDHDHEHETEHGHGGHH